VSGFGFSLEPLLQQRKSIEDEKVAALVRAQGRLETARRHLARLESEFARAFGDIRRSGSALPAELERSIAAARATVSQSLDITSQAQTAVLEAARDRKVLEELKRRRLAEFAAREARKEERELDEANLVAWQTSRRAVAR
jgi:flagellar export protein FliJ